MNGIKLGFISIFRIRRLSHLLMAVLSFGFIATAFQNCGMNSGFIASSTLASGESYCAVNSSDPLCKGGSSAVLCSFNGQNIPEGNGIVAFLNSTVTAGSDCQSQIRTCKSGSLSGNYSYATCGVARSASCLFNGRTIADGEQVTGFLQSTAAVGETCKQETRICNQGVMSGSYAYGACAVAQAASCLFNGQTVAHGTTVIGFLSSSQPAGQVCAPQSRTCLNGVLSGSGDYASCSVGTARACQFNGQSIASGQNVTGFTSSSVPAGQRCQANTRVCNDGVLSGSGDYASCAVDAVRSCLVNGKTIADGAAISLYLTGLPDANGICQVENRTCTAGVLSGSATAETCQPVSSTIPGCSMWPSGVASLQDAVNNQACVQVSSGQYELGKAIYVPSHHRLVGVSKEKSTLRASIDYVFTDVDTLVGVATDGTDVQVSDMTLDGRGLATYLIGFNGYTIQNTNMINGRCSAVGILGTGVVVKNNLLDKSSQPTNHPTRGHVGCETIPDNWSQTHSVGYGGVTFGAAICGAGYTEGGVNSQPRITGNEIMRSYGPALDNAGIWGGIFDGNNVHDNVGWAAVSLYGSSHWQITNNLITHPTSVILTNGTLAEHQGQEYHLRCADTPWGSHPAGIFLCEDSDALNYITTDNLIKGNTVQSYFGILTIGNDQESTGGRAYWAPRFNQFQDNNVLGSNIGCAEAFPLGQTDSNVWSGNNCAGVTGSGPSLFKSAAGNH